MDEIKNICNDNSLLLFEDSAQALGSKFKDQFAGTFGFYNDYNGGSGGPVDSNGDDHIAIVTSASGITYADSTTWTVIDAFGNPGTDGSNQWHEFEDGRAERKSSVQNPVATWNQSSNCLLYTSPSPRDS